MKSNLFLLGFVCLIVPFFITHFAHAQDSQPLLRLIYFLPSDREPQPEIDAKIDRLIKDTQQLYADLMEGHGLSRKTFTVETDASGKAVVHHVVGKFTDQYYSNSNTSEIWNELENRFDLSKNFYLTMIETSSESLYYGSHRVCGLGSYESSTAGKALFPASGDCADLNVTAHELGHAFGLQHDFRGDAERILLGIPDEMVTTLCAAEWLHAHRAFNQSQPPINENTTIEMSQPRQASSPGAIHLRFEVTDPDGIHQVQLSTPERGGWGIHGGLIGYKALNGKTRSTVEFVTKLAPESESVSLQVIDVHGNFITFGSFPINIKALLPRSQVVSIPDPNLAAAIQQEIGNQITTHTMLNLWSLDAPNRGIEDLTGLEHAHNLKRLPLSSNAITDISPLQGLQELRDLDLSENAILDISALSELAGLRFLRLRNNGINDVSALSGLTQLRDLDLGGNAISDVSALSGLTQLVDLFLWDNRITNVSALSGLTQLRNLNLDGNNISNVSPLVQLDPASIDYHRIRFSLRNNPLSNASIYRHIPAMQVKGIEVVFDSGIPKITGPWLWMIAPTEAGQGGANSINIDSLTKASGGSVTEKDIATNGAKAGDIVGDYAWTPGRIAATGWNNVNDTLNRIGVTAGEVNDYSSYALITLESAAAQSGVTMHVGSDDAIKVWLNGEVVHTNPINRGADDFQESFKVNLKKGDNLLLVKVSEWIVGWSMFVGIDADVNASYKRPLDAVLSPDVNGDGVVNIQDLVLVASNLGRTGKSRADVNGDGVVNIQDLVMVAAALGQGTAASPSLHVLDLEGLTAAEVQDLLTQAHQMALTDPAYLQGIAVLKQLFALLLPKEMALLPNYPNPFNPETWIPYQLAEPAEVTLHIYAVNGALVRTLALGHQAAGMYQSRNRAAYWDGRNAHDEKVASGVYFYTLTAGDFTATRKLLTRK